MTQSKENRFRPALVFITAIALLLTLVATPRQADACGSYGLPTDEELVQRTIMRHLHALTKGDRKAVNASWSLDAGRTTTLVSEGGVEKIRSEAIGNASRRWAKNKDEKMTWKIEQLDVDQNAAFAKLAITWHGQKRVEYLTLLKVNSAWTLVGKVHVAAEPLATASKTVSPY